MEKSMSLDTDFKNLKETLQDVLKLLTKLMKITWHLYTMLCVMVMWRLSNCCWSMEQVNQKHTKQSQPLVWPSDLLYVMLAGRDWWISIRSVNNVYDWRKFWKRFCVCFVFQSRVSTKTVVSARQLQRKNWLKLVPHLPHQNHQKIHLYTSHHFLLIK